MNTSATNAGIRPLSPQIKIQAVFLGQHKYHPGNIEKPFLSASGVNSEEPDTLEIGRTFHGIVEYCRAIQKAVCDTGFRTGDGVRKNNYL